MANGRNEPCLCGSGKKAKHCCGAKKTFMATHGPTALVAVVLAIGASAIIAGLKRDNSAPPTPPRALAQQTLPIPATTPPTPASATPQQGTALTPPVRSAAPPGPAPEGKVWSAEHGHWHNASTASPIRIDAAGGGAPAATSPTGEAPPQPGMIWSAEHKHWHFPETDSKIGNVRPFPRGLPPARPTQSTPKPQPAGPVPEGMEWSTEHGHWHKKASSPQR